MRTKTLVLMLVVATYAHGAPAAQTPPPGATPGACLKDVHDYAAKRRLEIPPPLPADADAAARSARALARSEAARKVDADRLIMARACAARFTAKTVPDDWLVDLALLADEAGVPELARSAAAGALGARSLSEADLGVVLLKAIVVGLTEPRSAERNAWLERCVGRLDTISDAAALDRKIAAHERLLLDYRGAGIDEATVRHGTWIVDASKGLTGDQRKRYGAAVGSGYASLAEVLSGQGKGDDALAQLRLATAGWGDVPAVAALVRPVIDRLALLGTAAAPITAPRWLNLPAGQTALELTGHVTLLEFSAHWCTPCSKSYPGVNRLREKYGARGLQVVLVTKLWGQFQAESLDAAGEFARDRAYFAGHGLDVPIAVGDQTTTSHRDRNDVAYRVGGIPQIHLIDRHGTIRLVMTGYDEANEADLGRMIESMLNDRSR